MPLTVTWPVEWCEVMIGCAAMVAAAGTAASRVVSRDDRIGTAPYRTERLAQATLTTPSRAHAYRAVSAARSGSTYLVAAASPATIPLDHAHWKLNPPSLPSPSRISPPTPTPLPPPHPAPPRPLEFQPPPPSLRVQPLPAQPYAFRPPRLQGRGVALRQRHAAR